MIETDDGIKFGGYIEAPIDKLNKFIEDKNIFLFTFKDNEPKKFDIIYRNRAFGSFKVLPNAEERLFQFGLSDIVINKSNSKNKSECKEDNSHYYYSKKDGKVLIGRKTFKVKHIQVFQMKFKEGMTNDEREIMKQ